MQRDWYCLCICQVENSQSKHDHIPFVYCHYELRQIRLDHRDTNFGCSQRCICFARQKQEHHEGYGDHGETRSTDVLQVDIS